MKFVSDIFLVYKKFLETFQEYMQRLTLYFHQRINFKNTLENPKNKIV